MVYKIQTTPELAPQKHARLAWPSSDRQAGIQSVVRLRFNPLESARLLEGQPGSELEGLGHVYLRNSFFQSKIGDCPGDPK